MSAFGNPWGDIDKTKEGAPYVVSDDGWGWLGLAILALVPVVLWGLHFKVWQILYLPIRFG